VGSVLGAYAFGWRSRPSERPPVTHVVLAGLPAVTPDDRARVERAVAVGRAAWRSRTLSSVPSNVKSPAWLADQALDLACEAGLTSRVWDERELADLGFGGIVAVGQGSATPPRLVRLDYAPAGAGRRTPTVVLVGKGITFDTGGVSIKPAADMDEMKYDMCGAASVLGVFRALGEIRPAINVVGLIPSCENMVSGRALKPGDVVTSMSGQTIEVLNTDAEGRLVLCDALTYAQRFSPRAVIDIATLTGACVVALGGVRSGLFASDDALATALAEAGERALDRCWRMPLDDEYADGLKTSYADVANIGGRAGGAITAAKFLQRFAVDVPWAHLDIAGTAWKSGAAKGSTGRPVGLLLAYLLAQAEAGVAVADGAAEPAVAKTPRKSVRKAAAKSSSQSAAKSARAAP